VPLARFRLTGGPTPSDRPHCATRGLPPR